MKVDILGVKIDNLSLQEILEQVKKFLESKNKYYIVTPNPEFLVAAQRDKNFKEILNYADIAIPDGVGLIYAAKFLGERLQQITGIDFIFHLMDLAQENNYSIYLLGGRDEVAKKTADFLIQEFPNLKVVGAESGGEIVIANSKWQIANSKIIENINKAKPDILLVAFGQVKQEKWIFYNLDKLPSVKLAMGVGGAFDYISGEVPRAPVILRRLGLEWLYRLYQEPWRWKRIIDAIIIFPLLILKSKIWKKK